MRPYFGVVLILVALLAIPVWEMAHKGERYPASPKRAKTIVCQVQAKGGPSQKLEIDTESAPSGGTLTAAGFELVFGLILKYGDYDTYPNVTIDFRKGGQTQSQVTLVGNNDEYGAFALGASNEAWGRCDVSAWTK
jgi:hypothetical protein